MIPRNLAGLIAIVTVAWLLILFDSYLFIAVIRPLGPPIHEQFLPSSVLKVILTASLGALWVGVMFALDHLYAKRGKRWMTPT